MGDLATFLCREASRLINICDESTAPISWGGTIDKIDIYRIGMFQERL
jgi:hypothetical protein